MLSSRSNMTAAAECRVSIGNLDRDQQPPLEEGSELPGNLAQQRYCRDDDDQQ
ncbi:MAG: hypothetical protein ABSH35_25620 [Isosphaeraceae bacterium]